MPEKDHAHSLELLAEARLVARFAGVPGAVLGVCAGIVQLAYGSSIPDWTGNKMDTTGLGLATIGLSIVAGAAIWRLLRTSDVRWQIALAIVSVACAVVCFTTVGRLWYVPGPLLILATVLGLCSSRRLRA